MPSVQFDVTTIKPSELKPLTEIVLPALLVPYNERKKVREIMKARSIENFRAVRYGRRIVGGLFIYYWGHFFGGKSVPAAAIADVGVAPEHRRLGAASKLLVETLRELHRDGVAISTLYPANFALYRKTGYERAMEHAVFEIKLADIRLRNMALDAVPHEGKSLRILKEIYKRFASATNGNVDRDEIEWDRIAKPWFAPDARVYLFKRGREVEGYVILWFRERDRTLVFHDYAVLSRDAAERLVTLLADHSTVVEKALFPGSYNDPLLQFLPVDSYKLTWHPDCMLRIVSVPRALRARGYPAGVEAELHLEVSDDILGENIGRLVLKVRDGKGTLKRGGEGRIKLDIRALAQLYTGFMSPGDLRLAGNLVYPDDDLPILQTVFSGPRPWIRDDF
jgi:predicted acetyltransferase